MASNALSHSTADLPDVGTSESSEKCSPVGEITPDTAVKEEGGVEGVVVPEEAAVWTAGVVVEDVVDVEEEEEVEVTVEER